MTSRKSAIAASVKEASRGKAALVFASNMESLPKFAEDMVATLVKTKYAKFGCTACGTSMASRADTTPFCITCGAGDGHVHTVEGDVKLNVTSKTELVALNCDQCSASTVVEAGVAQAILASGKKSTPIHCSCCGNPMVVSADASSISDEPLITPTPAEVKSDAGSVGGEDNFDDDMDLDALGSLEDFDDDGEDSDVELDENGMEVTADPTALTTPGGPVGKEEFSAPMPEADTQDMPLELEPFSIEQEVLCESDPSGMEENFGSESETEDDNTLEMTSDTEGDPLVDALDMDDTQKALAFVKANGRLVAMKGHVAIATLSKTSRTPNAKLINSPALQAATKHSVSTEGLRAGLQSVGFTLIKVPVTSKASLERRVQEITAKTAATETAKQKTFAQSFALAAAGLNRGQWKGVANPLRAAMETELTRAGVEQPRRVVSSVFEAAGLSYAEALLATSNRLSKMSASARNELAEVLNMTAATSPEDEHAQMSDEDIDQSHVEARFSSGGRSTAALLRPRITASAESTSQAANILSGNAPLNFSF